jgi:hypothetical protein
MLLASASLINKVSVPPSAKPAHCGENAAAAVLAVHCSGTCVPDMACSYKAVSSGRSRLAQPAMKAMAQHTVATMRGVVGRRAGMEAPVNEA